ncbi:hypothetical protein HMPREF1624_07266 [Sporothrix schenckii ATCC 58251]|uniref:DUF7514 domain-containing protein n=1 Tax=Sporothrix schenckii (strain ATCC 58251 / de Perez 2211183) TaxID=1391915 RepID=U7PN30_SPOS1|nr:hypothetical protein HMPREF1624_07266 [Sporothrix schenckii ATCC 58251]
MTPAQPVSFRSVSYSPQTGDTRLGPSSSSRQPKIPLERRSAVHFDDECAPDDLRKAAVPVDTKVPAGVKICNNGSNRSASRSSSSKNESETPKATTRLAHASLDVGDTGELTCVDKKWGDLFEIDNQPTERFREVMHSLSRYISGDRDSNRRVADLYQDLGCTYHLVQESPGLQPRVPGLTPDGFTRWMVLHLQAFPDGVSQRLNRIMSDFPLDVVSPLDGRIERLPKQLSRYLLPRVPDGRIRSLLQQAVKRHFGESALLAPLFPEEKASRSTAYKSQTHFTSPPPRNMSSPSASTPAIVQACHRDGRARGQSPAPVAGYGHRVSDPGAVSISTDEKVFLSTHRRHASYPGSQSRSGRGNELVQDHRDLHGGEHQREDRRQRSSSQSRSSRPYSRLGSRQSSRHNSPVSSEKEEDTRRPHRWQHPLRDVDHHRSASQDNYRRSSSRSRHMGVASHSSSCLASGTKSSGHDGQRSKYPPSSLVTVTNASTRRAPSPKNRSFRTSLPEIHSTDQRRPSTARDGYLARDAMEHSAEINRRASCYGPPSAAVQNEAHRTTSREYGTRMECPASSGEEQNYQLYGSPVSSMPILHRNSIASTRETIPKVHRPSQAKTEVAAAPHAPASSPRVHPTRAPVSLVATVTSLEEERASLVEDDGTESDQTWEDYLRTSPRVAPVA